MVVAGSGRRTGCALLVGAVVVVLGSLLTDSAGRVLALPAALLLAAAAARELVLQPVLRADPDGLEVVVGLRRHRVAWDDVERLRVVRDRRTPLLEIDLGSTLVVLSRARLGRSPDDVLAELSALQG